MTCFIVYDSESNVTLNGREITIKKVSQSSLQEIKIKLSKKFSKHVHFSANDCPDKSLTNINQQNTNNKQKIIRTQISEKIIKKIKQLTKNTSLTVNKKICCSKIESSEFQGIKLNRRRKQLSNYHKFFINKNEANIFKGDDKYCQKKEITSKNKVLFKDRFYDKDIYLSNCGYNLNNYTESIRNFWKQKVEENRIVNVKDSKITKNLQTSERVINYSFNFTNNNRLNIFNDIKETEKTNHLSKTPDHNISERIETTKNIIAQVLNKCVIDNFNALPDNFQKEVKTAKSVPNKIDNLTNNMICYKSNCEFDYKSTAEHSRHVSNDHFRSTEFNMPELNKPNKTEQNNIKQCNNCSCNIQGGKCRWRICHYSTISESLFFGPTLDEIILVICNFFRIIGEKIGLIKVDPNKKTKTCMGCKFYNKNYEERELHEPSKNQLDVVKWLHDEYLRLAKDVAEANAALEHNCPCTKDNCPIVLQSRRFVLDRLAELLEKKQELEMAYSKKNIDK